MSRFMRSRGAVSRVASALLFACAALAVVVFPEGEAGGISAKFGFRPAQVPVEDLGVASDEYNNPLLCADLGGKVENAPTGESICSEIDLNDTFCVVGADEAFPCRGLFKHVLLCNAAYERPALNPFFCGARCDASSEKARGGRCERFFPADEILPEAARTITVSGLTEGATGAIATLQAAIALSGPDLATYGAFEIVNHRPADHPDSDGLIVTVDGGNRLLEIHRDHRLGQGELARTVVAKSFCSSKEGVGAEAKEKCYPTFLTLAVEFSDVVARVDIPLASVVAEANRRVSIDVAAGHSGPGYRISLVDAAAYDLTGHRYNSAAHGYDAVNDIIVIDTPIDPALGPLVAAVTADVVCLSAGALCREAELTVTAIFYPIVAEAQTPLSTSYKRFVGGNYVFPAKYRHETVSGAARDGTALALAGVNGYAGDLADLGVELTIDSGNNFPILGIEGLRAPAALPVGEYTLTVGLTHKTLLGTIFADIPLEILLATPSEREYGLLGASPREVDVTVVGDYADAIFETAYSGRRDVGGSDPGALLLPEVQPDGLSLELSQNGLDLAVYPAVPVRAGAALGGVASVTVTVNRNYEALAQPLTVRVSALSRPGAVAVNGPAPYATGEIAVLGTGAYADAIFGKESGSAELDVDAAGRVSVIAEIAAAGVHNMVVTATSAGFLGVARFEVELNVDVAGAVPSDLSIPTPARRVFRAVAPGYAGTVAFFAAARAGVTLETGDDSGLSGFSFVTDSGASAANSEHVSPAGFFLSVDADIASAGEVSVAAFEVTAKREESTDTAIALEVTVSVISSPEQIELRTNATADFEHPLVLPAGYEYGAVLSVRAPEVDSVPQEFEIVNGKLTPIDGVARGFGDVIVEVAVTHPDFYGEVVLTVTVKTARVIDPAQVLANRDVTVTVVSGYSGPGYQFPVDSEYTIVGTDYDSGAGIFGYDAETYAVEILSGNPVAGDNLTVEIAATVDCAGVATGECARETILLSVTFVPLSPLAQTELNAVYDEDFAHLTRIPDVLRAGATLSVAAVRGGSGNLFALNANGEIIRGPGASPPAGGYTIRVDMTHAGFLGTLSFQVVANISPAELDPAAHLLEAERAYVAAGYTGGLHQNIVLPSSAAESVLELPEDSPAGLTLALAGNNREIAVELTDAISGEIVRTITVNVTRGGNYNDLQRVVILTVTALGVPPLLAERGTAATGRPFSRVLRDLASGEYEGGNYAGGIFEDVFDGVEGESEDLRVSRAGAVSTKRDLDAGDYGITIVASGRPSAAGANFAGTATITVQLSVTVGVVDLDADEVVLPAARNVVLDAAAGYFGRGYEIPVEAGHTLLASAQYEPNLLSYEDGVISILDTNPVGTTGLTLSLVVIGDCADDTADECNNVPVSVVAEFQAVAVPAQPSGSAAYREGFTVPLTLPAGYESGARRFRNLEVTRVEDSEGAPVDLTGLNVSGDDLQYAPDAAQGGALDMGVYTIAVELSQTDPESATDSLLGTLTLEVEAVITPRDLDPANYGLSAPERATITVAAGDGAIGAELARVSLSDSAAGALVVLPDVLPNGLLVSLAGESSVAVFYLKNAVSSSDVFSETTNLSVTLNDNHNLLAQPVGVTVSALRQQDAVEVGGQIPLASGVYENANIYDFQNHPSGDYANAVFLKATDGGNSASLTVSAEGVIGTDVGGITLAGLHTITVKAASEGDYAGNARLELVLDLVRQGELQSDHTIPQSARTRLQPVAPGYAGSVAFFAAGREGVTLETPADPANFSFGTGGASRDYTSPDGFTLHVNAGVAASAGDTETASFEVIAKDAGGPGGPYGDSAITVMVTVSVLRAPRQADVSVDATTNFDRALALEGIPGGLDGDNGALSIVGVVKDGAEDGTNPFRLEGANLRPTNAGGVVFGDYEVSISWSHPKFLGELTLAVDVEVAEVIDVDAVVPAAGRNVTVTVVEGYTGIGHAIPLQSDYAFVSVLYDDTAAGYDRGGNVIQILSGNTPTTDIVELAVTLVADCAATNRNCARQRLTVSATFVPLRPFAQATLEADDDAAFSHRVSTGAYGGADVIVVEGDGAGASDVFAVEETAADSGVWNIVRGSPPPDAGLYTVFLEMTDDGFRGSLPLAVTASIRETIDPADAVVNRNPTADAAAGYTGSAYTILVESGYLLTSEAYDSNLLGYDAENKVISIVSTNPVPLAGELAVTLTAEARCEDAARNCRPEDIEVVATFPVIDAAQDTATELFMTGWTVSLKFPAGYGNGEKSGRDTRILHPLPRDGNITADGASCAALGGSHQLIDDTCRGYARSLEDSDAVAGESRGQCTFSDNSFFLAVHYSCDLAFTKARDCNAANQPLVNNSECGADCGADAFALGGKCLALKLSADGDILEHAPGGAADAMNAGTGQVIVGMTETDLLGTVLLEVGTDISPIDLPGRFNVSAPARATITIAAGDGAVGEELARVGLTVADDAIGAAIVQPASDIVGKVSVDILPRSAIQTLVFYLDKPLDGRMTAEIVAFTVSSSNQNYIQSLQSVTLNIEALAEPELAEESGVAGPANPYSNANVHDFKTGNSGSYANATFAAGDRSVQLTVDENGIVSTTEDITAGGTYRLTAHATSPDFIGTATLELRLDLAAEGEFTPARTIPSSQRSQDVVVVPGYSGSVAFFAAQTLGVTLRTPAAPTDFSFGTDGAERDYASPDGFTLFLDDGRINAAGETAVAEFAVTAKAAGFTTQEILLTVNVAALTVPGRTDLTAREESADYGAVGGHASYPIGGAISASIAGVAVSAAGALTPLSDPANRVRLAGANLSPVDADEANERFAAGRYVITVEMTHADFRGTLTLEVAADIRETLDEDLIVAAEGRQATITVATGYSGDGYTVPLDPAYEFEAVLFESDKAEYDDARNVITLSVAVTERLDLAVTATANCAAASARNCAPLALTVSAAFIPLEPYVQTPLIATQGDDFPAHLLNVGDRTTGVTLSINGIAVDGGAAAGDEFELQGLGIVRNQMSAPSAGRYTITVEMTHADFRGTLSLAVTARIQERLDVNDVLAAADRTVTVTVSRGYSGDGYTVPLHADYVFDGVAFESDAADYDDARNVIRLSAAVMAELEVAATATASCATATNRDCAPLALTVRAKFVPLTAQAQTELTANYNTEFNHPLVINNYNADDVNLAVVGVDGGGVELFQVNDSGKIVRSDANNTPTAKGYTITVEMTHKSRGFLGVLTLEVTANITPKPLDLAGFGFSTTPAGKVVIAAGTGAVNQEIARVAVARAADTEATTVSASIQEQTVYPANLSLEFLPATGDNPNQMVAFHLTAALTGDGAEVARETALTITSANQNYGLLAQILTLTITALRTPTITVVKGTVTTGSSYPANANVHNFKSGDYAAATRFVRVGGATELSVNEESGIVSAPAAIAVTGRYMLTVDVTSPDFAGTARLVMNLDLVAEDAFGVGDTIPDGERVQNIGVVPGYSGQVAFFRAGRNGVILQAPSELTDGFSFGADADAHTAALGAEFTAPAGLPLFLDAGQIPTAGDSLAAVFTVTAKEEGFTSQEIPLTVTVKRVSPAAAIAEPLTVDHDAAEYFGAVPTPNDYSVDGANPNPFEIVGVGIFVDDGSGGGGFTGSLANHDERVRITGDNLEPVDATDEDDRLAPGRYQITVEMTHSGFVGTLTLTIPLVVETRLNPDDVVAAADRTATRAVANGHFGDDGDAGHVVTVKGAHKLANFSSADAEVSVNETNNEIHIRASRAVTAELAAVVTATVTCDDDARNCAALAMTLSATFTPVTSRVQDALNAVVEAAAYDHLLLAPQDYGFDDTGAALNIARVTEEGGNLADATLINIDADYRLQPNRKGLPAGNYAIVVEMTHPGFLGALGLTVSADIRTPVTADDVLKAEGRNVVQQVVPGYPADSDGRVVAIDDDYILEDLTYDTNNFLVVADAGKGEYEVKLAVAMPSDNDLVAAVTANVKCAAKGPVNCAEQQFVMTVTFKRLAAMAQTLLKAGDKGAADYDHDIELEHSLTNLELRIAGAKDTGADAAVSDIATRVKIEGGQLKRYGNEENQRLAIGNYEITVEAEALNSQTGFLGTLPVVITAEILDSVEPDSVVAAADRAVILSVAVGHEGDSGHVITVNAGYALSNAAVDNADFNVFPIGNNYGIRFAQPMPNSEIEAVVTAEAGCTDDAASPAPGECAPTVLTITATFKPVSFDGVVQTELNANDDADYDHRGYFAERLHGGRGSGSCRPRPGRRADLPRDSRREQAAAAGGQGRDCRTAGIRNA